MPAHRAEVAALKAGGQPGHVGRAREPVPPEQVDEFVDVHPERCGVCGAELPPEAPAEDAYAHQVTNLPEAPARVTEYRLWRKRCPHWGGRTRAKRPAHVPEDAFGPRLKAVVTALTAKYRVSRREMVEVLRDLFRVWHAYRRGDIDRPRMMRDMEPIENAWDAAVNAAIESSDHRLAMLGADLWRQWDCLWTFVRVEGVEPTNNDAERALRPAVLWRKGCFGARSDRGSTFVGRILTVVHTAKRRRIDLVPWLRDACENAAAGLAPAPLLSG